MYANALDRRDAYTKRDTHGMSPSIVVRDQKTTSNSTEFVGPPSSEISDDHQRSPQKIVHKQSCLYLEENPLAKDFSVSSDTIVHLCICRINRSCSIPFLQFIIDPATSTFPVLHETFRDDEDATVVVNACFARVLDMFPELQSTYGESLHQEMFHGVIEEDMQDTSFSFSSLLDSVSPSRSEDEEKSLVGQRAEGLQQLTSPKKFGSLYVVIEVPFSERVLQHQEGDTQDSSSVELEDGTHNTVNQDSLPEEKEKVKDKTGKSPLDEVLSWYILDEIVPQTQASNLFMEHEYLGELVDNNGKTIPTPKRLYRCVPHEEGGGWDVLNQEMIDIPTHHSWLGDAFYFSSFPMLSSGQRAEGLPQLTTEDVKRPVSFGQRAFVPYGLQQLTQKVASLPDEFGSTNAQRYAVFVVQDKYIVHDIAQLSEEQKTAFTDKYEDIDVVTIYFHENDHEIWCVKSADNFTRL